LKWDEGYDPLFTHLAKLPRCSFAHKRNRLREEIDQCIRKAKRNDVVAQQIAYRLTQPVNSAFEADHARVTSFKDVGRLPTASDRFVASGFYYVGPRDRVKCYYCNGEIQNFSAFDNPWVEHAKWFPHCPYVLRWLGVETVQKIGEFYGRPSVTQLPTMRSNDVTSSLPLIASKPQVLGELTGAEVQI